MAYFYKTSIDSTTSSGFASNTGDTWYLVSLAIDDEMRQIEDAAIYDFLRFEAMGEREHECEHCGHPVD